MPSHTSSDEQTEPVGKPSQAEGERQPGRQQDDPAEGPAGKPSQAEGDRETVEEDLRQKSK